MNAEDKHQILAESHQHEQDFVVTGNSKWERLLLFAILMFWPVLLSASAIHQLNNHNNLSALFAIVCAMVATSFIVVGFMRYE